MPDGNDAKRAAEQSAARFFLVAGRRRKAEIRKPGRCCARSGFGVMSAHRKER